MSNNTLLLLSPVTKEPLAEAAFTVCREPERIRVDNFIEDYTQLAGAELEAARISTDESGRNHHLNRAAVFACLGDSEAQGLSKPADMTAIGRVLVAAMALADGAGASIVSIHIDSALVALAQHTIGPGI